MSHEILWVTSFNKKLYEHSGRKLLDTFARFKVPGKMFIAHEDKLAVQITQQEKSLCIESDFVEKTSWLYDLEDSGILKRWLKDNEDIIPKHLGGKAMVCKCVGGANPRPKQKHEKPGCRWTWWNRNCSRWFRKIPALHAAWNLGEGHRYIIWIDCDCYFIENAENFSWKDMIGDAPGFYMKGPRRAVIEGGVVGYDTQTKMGSKVYEEIERIYLTGEFRNHERWDDSFIVQIALENIRRMLPKKKPFMDVAAGVVTRDGHITKRSLVGRYVRHNKGEHAREGLTG